MELGMIGNKGFETYMSMCSEAGFVRAKLGNKEISQGKREKLVYRLSDLEERIIPRQVHLININDGVRFGQEKIG